MKKIFVILIFFLAFLASGTGLAFLLILRGQSFDQLAREKIKPLAESIFNREVDFRRFEIKNFNKIAFYEVAIAREKSLKDGAIIKAPEIIIKFNPVLFFLKKDFLKSIYEIKGLNLEVYLEHARRGGKEIWNILELLPLEKPGEQIKMKIIVENGRLHFSDTSGFWPDFQAPFKTQGSNIFGEADFRNRDYFRFSVFGNLEENGFLKSVKSAGFVKWADNSFQIKLETPPLNLASWAGYILKIPGFSFKSGEASLSLEFVSPVAQEPLAINGQVVLKDCSCSFNEISLELSDISGPVFLKGNSLELAGLRGSWAKNNLSFEGTINNFFNPEVNISVSGEKFHFSDFSQFFPGFNNQAQLNGNFDFFANFVGKAENLFASGLVYSATGEFKPLGQYKNLNLAFKWLLNSGKIEYELKELLLFGGSFWTKGTVDFSVPELELAGDFKIKKVDLAKQAFIPNFTGRVSGAGSFSSDFKGLQLTTWLSFSPESRIWGEPLESLALEVSLKEKNVSLQNFLLTFKEKSFLKATGKGQLNGNFSLSLTGKNIYFQNNSSGFVNDGTMYFESQVSGQLTPAIFRHLETLTYKTSLKIKKGRFFNQPVAVAELDFVLKDGTFSISKLFLKEKSSELRGSGIFKPADFVNFNVTGKKILFQDLKILSFYLPRNFKNISGSVSLEMSFNGKLPKEWEILLTPKVFETVELSSQIILEKAQLGQQFLDKGEIKFTWKNPRLNFEKFDLVLGKSELSLAGNIFKNGDLDFSSAGQINLSDFDYLIKNLAPWIKKYDHLAGEIVYSGVFKDNFLDPTFRGYFKGLNFNFNQISLENLEASSVILENKIFYFGKPLTIRKGKEIYELTGKIDLNPFTRGLKAGRIVAPLADLQLRLVAANLETISQISSAITGEILARIKTSEATREKIEIVFPPPAQNPPQEKNVLYQNLLGTGKRGIIEFYREVKKSSAKKDTLFGKDFLKRVSGEIAGTLKISGDLGKPEGQLNLQLKNVRAPFVSGRGLLINGKLSNQSGQSHTYQPRLKFNFEIKEAVLGGANFSKINGEIDYLEGAINFNKIEFWAGSQRAELKGYWPYPFEKEGQGQNASLTLLVEKSGLKILETFIKDLEWRSGEGQAQLSLSGPVNQLSLDGFILMKDVFLKYQPASKEATILSEVNARLDIQKNIAYLKYLNFKWQGKSTKKKVNSLGLQGKFDLNQAFSGNWRIMVEELRLNPTTIFLDLPLIYSGKMTLKNFVFQGKIDASFWQPENISEIFIFSINPAKKEASPNGLPKLKGELYLSEGTLVIPEANNLLKFPDINLELLVSIGSGVKLVGAPFFVTGKRELSGLITSGLLTGLNLEIEETKESLVITGTPSEPEFEKYFVFTGGGFSFLGRPFTLLKPLQQRMYFSQNLSKVTENYLEFKTGQTLAPSGSLKTSLISNLRLVAETEVTKRTNGAGYSEKRKILAIMEGPIGDLDIIFEEYKPGLAGPFEFVARYTLDDAQAVIKLLVPQLFTTLIGSGDRSEAVREFSAQQIQSVFRSSLRPLEEKIESSAGLDEVRFEYDLGERLARSFFGRTPSSGVKELVGISLAKRFLFDKLYLRFKFAQDIQSLGKIQDSLLTYQLVYWLNENFSLDYTREIDEANYNLLYNDTFTLGAKYNF